MSLYTSILLFLELPKVFALSYEDLTDNLSPPFQMMVQAASLLATHPSEKLLLDPGQIYIFNEVKYYHMMNTARIKKSDSLDLGTKFFHTVSSWTLNIVFGQTIWPQLFATFYKHVSRNIPQRGGKSYGSSSHHTFPLKFYLGTLQYTV